MIWPLKPEIHIISHKEIQPSNDMIERQEFKCKPFDETHAAISVFCKYFSMKGGVFWRCVEKDGQATSVNLTYNVHKQTLTLAIKNAKNLKTTHQIVNCLLVCIMLKLHNVSFLETNVH